VHNIAISHEASKYGFLLFGSIGVILFYCLITYITLYALGIPLNLRHGGEKGKNGD
jgi:hypothetical protein